MKPTDIDVDEHRKPDWPIEPLLYRRWSPRAMSGEEMSEEMWRAVQAVIDAPRA